MCGYTSRRWRFNWLSLALQRMKNSLIICALFLGMFFQWGCRKSDFSGTPNGNLPPKTFTVVDTIFRSGDDRLTTTVAIQWWGDDPDGYVTGYEFTFDEIISSATNWIFTTRLDSIFLLAVPAGSDTFDFSFSVRAVDNLGERDPNPARVKYPVKNSPPTVSFVYAPNGGNPLAGGNPVYSFPAVKYEWNGNDPDGFSTLEGYELYLNDTLGTAYSLPAVFSSVILKAADLSGSTTEAIVYAGNNNNPLSLRMQGMLLNDTNRLYIRAVDQSGARSLFEVANPIYIKKPASRFLLLNAYSNDPNPELNASTIDAFYEAQFATIGISAYEKLQIFQRANNRFVNLSPDNRTQSMVFEFFDEIVWAGPDFEYSIVFTRNTMGGFLNNGGKLLLSTAVTDAAPVTSNFFELSPIDSLLPVPEGTTSLLWDTSTFVPRQAGYPTLRHTGFASIVRPMKFTPGTSVLYKANILSRDQSFNITPYTGPSDIMGLRTNNINGSKFVISTVEIHRMRSNNNVDQLLSRILIDEFGL